MILSVSVFDDNNTLLVRSPAVNESTINSEPQFSFPSAITLNDTLISNVNVRLNTHHLKSMYQGIYSTPIGFLLISLCDCLWLATNYTGKLNRLFASLNDRMDNILFGDTIDSTESKTDPKRWQPILEKKLDSISTQTIKLKHSSPLFQRVKYNPKNTSSPSGYALLIIECLNINQIQRQISHRLTKKILEEFQHIVDQYTLLYSGENIKNHGKYLLLRFDNDENHDAALRLIFCSRLIISMGYQPAGKIRTQAAYQVQNVRSLE